MVDLGPVQLDRRGEPLATGLNTTDGNHAFALLDSPGGGILRSVFIGVGPGEGPCLATAVIFDGGDVRRAIGTKPALWIRSPLLGGLTGDAFVFNGELPYTRRSTLRIYVRNDTGSTVSWGAIWSAQKVL